MLSITLITISLLLVIKLQVKHINLKGQSGWFPIRYNHQESPSVAEDNADKIKKQSENNANVEKDLSGFKKIVYKSAQTKITPLLISQESANASKDFTE